MLYQIGWRTHFSVTFLLLLSLFVLGCTPSTSSALPKEDEGVAQKTKLPRLLDVGNGMCIPCKQMMPILDELKKDYQGKLEVEYIELRDDRDASSRYKIRMIPTQIFYSASGEELYRHEGFFSKEEILTKWKELGIQL